MRCEACNQELTDQRSLDQNQMFHVLMNEAFLHWPDKSAFKPDNKEHLRAFLLVKAKHSITHHINLPDRIDPKHIKMTTFSLMQCLKPNSFMKIDANGKGFSVAVSKSTAFKECSPDVFQRVIEDVLDIIEVDYIPNFRREFLPPDLKGFTISKQLVQPPHQIAPD